MNHIKLFEAYKDYIYNKDMFTISDIMKYLKVDNMLMYEESKLETIYDVDVIEFLKEIFINKTIIFRDINRFEKNRSIKGTVNDIGIFSYKETYIKVKILNPKELVKNNVEIKFKEIQHEKNEDNWFLIDNNSMISIYDYDADSKPLHKKVKLKKESEKYNL